jgi:hypothetical protein
VIFWNGFALDEVLGPLLVTEHWDESFRRSGETRARGQDGQSSSTAQGCASIQETRQGQRPARMVGYQAIDPEQNRMDADERAHFYASRNYVGKGGV